MIESLNHCSREDIIVKSSAITVSRVSCLSAGGGGGGVLASCQTRRCHIIDPEAIIVMPTRHRVIRSNQLDSAACVWSNYYDSPTTDQLPLILPPHRPSQQLGSLHISLPVSRYLFWLWPLPPPPQGSTCSLSERDIYRRWL